MVTWKNWSKAGNEGTHSTYMNWLYRTILIYCKNDNSMGFNRWYNEERMVHFLAECKECTSLFTWKGIYGSTPWHGSRQSRDSL